MRLFRNLFRRRPAPEYRVGDLVRYGGRAMAISRMTDGAAELIWQDANHELHTAGFVPLHKIMRATP